MQDRTNEVDDDAEDQDDLANGEEDEDAVVFVIEEGKQLHRCANLR